MVEVVVEKKAKMSAQQSIVWLVVCTHDPHIERVGCSLHKCQKFRSSSPPSFPFLTPNDHEPIGMRLSNQTLAAGDAKL